MDGIRTDWDPTARTLCIWLAPPAPARRERGDGIDLLRDAAGRTLALVVPLAGDDGPPDPPRPPGARRSG